MQRIQSIYLFLAALVSGFSPSLPFYKVESQPDAAEYEEIITLPYLHLLGYAVAAIAIGVILAYSKRSLQMTLTKTLGLLLSLLCIAYTVLLYLDGYYAGGSGLILLASTIPLFIVAFRAIRKDDNLVKSIDRIR